MAYPYRYTDLTDFTGGLNDAPSLDNIADNELTIAENIDLMPRGGFTRRYGISEYKDRSTVNTYRIAELEYDNAGTRTIKRIILSDTKLIDVDDGTVYYTGLDKHMDWEVYRNKMYILGNGKYLVYDGTTITDVTNAQPDSLLTTVQKCRYISQLNNRIFVSGNPDEPNALYFCELGDPTYFKDTSGNPIMAITDDADVITGLAEYHEAMLVFKSRSVFAWFGVDPTIDVEFHKLDTHTGTKASQTICKVNDMLMFLGSDGVYALLGTYKNVINTLKLSDSIETTIGQIKYMPKHHENTHCAVFHDDKYMIAVPTVDTSENDLVLVFHNKIFKVDAENGEKNEPWTTYTGWKPNGFLHSLDGELYFSASTGGKIYKRVTTFNDAGSAIPVNVKLKPLDFGNLVNIKRFKRGYIALRQYSDMNSAVTIRTWTDFVEKMLEQTVDVNGNDSLIWDMDGRTWDNNMWDWADIVSRKFRISENGMRLVIQLQDSTLDNALTVYGFTIEWRRKRPNRKN